MRHFCVLFLLVLLASAPALAEPEEALVTTLGVGSALLKIKVARSREERARGLSGVESLPANEGMLFVIPPGEKIYFHMKGVKIPLTIAFIDSEGKILEIKDMIPGNPQATYPAPDQTRFALEANQGWFEHHGIRPGEVIRTVPLLAERESD